MCLAVSPRAAEAVAQRHSLDVGPAMGMRPAGGVGGAAVKTGHTLQEAFTPEERERRSVDTNWEMWSETSILGGLTQVDGCEAGQKIKT